MAENLKGVVRWFSSPVVDDRADVAQAIAGNEELLFHTVAFYEAGYLAAVVLTPSALLVNSAADPRHVDHTEVAIRIPLSAIGTLALKRTNLYARFMWQVRSESLVVSERSGRVRRFFFFRQRRESAEPLLDAINRALRKTPERESA
jgi:hypothetical protein